MTENETHSKPIPTAESASGEGAVQSVIMEPPVQTPPAQTIDKLELEEAVRRLLEPQPEEQSKMSPTGEFDADVIVIGSGPGGYVCAIRAAQLGARTVCIEKEATEWGGTCLNWGCIPTKALIASTERLHHVKTAEAMGVTISGEIGFNFGKMMERKGKIVSTLRGGVQTLLKSNHVRSVVGTAKLVDAHTVEVATAEGKTERITSKNIILATGSVPIVPPIPGLARDPKDKRGESSNGIWTSDEAVYAKSCPASMVIVGTGAVGLEFAYVFRSLGAEVTLVEIAPEILPAADREIAVELRKSLKKQGMTIHTNAKVAAVEQKGNLRAVTIETEKGSIVVEAEVVLVGAGRKAYFEGLGLEQIGVVTNRRGVEVNDYLQTSVPSIYAIGDVAGKQLLAHLASHMGIVAAENAMGHTVKMDYRAVPGPIYTVPEVAMVGLTEEQAKEQGYDVMTGRFPFRPLGRAMALNEQEGLVKVVAERKYGELLGVHIIGPFATELIHEGVMAIKLEATLEELMTSIHAHPTLSEAIGEAAMDAKGEAIHKPKK
jgi:dihydrolipoamide dehydrogenase